MANNYFQFKQFTIYQDKCAMKVCTDACLFGAIVANKIKDKPITNVLDIGTGTGLLSLMLAQKNAAINIDAIELELQAYEQASQNFNQSNWSNRIQPIWIDIKKYTASKLYDVIISNPPFFSNDLQSKKENHNIAKHSTTLTLTELFEATIPLLHQQGFFAILLPYHRNKEVEQLCTTHHLFINEKIAVRQTTQHDFFRIIYFLSKNKTTKKEKVMAIKTKANKYTKAFIDFLKDYYLML